ncbi:uncharacterized protein LOC126060293 [Elephas maximus indicus]|uniref:uncharacterized protein LOC126060293 n=1 Tax=Elephas maximus indicus TaxID=99487 RepID=UPI002116959B|nr:uncharacterized protein LOC126060293 [Elephas maximus indicus]
MLWDLNSDSNQLGEFSKVIKSSMGQELHRTAQAAPCCLHLPLHAHLLLTPPLSPHSPCSDVSSHLSATGRGGALSFRASTQALSFYSAPGGFHLIFQVTALEWTAANKRSHSCLVSLNHTHHFPPQRFSQLTFILILQSHLGPSCYLPSIRMCPYFMGASKKHMVSSAGSQPSCFTDSGALALLTENRSCFKKTTIFSLVFYKPELLVAVMLGEKRTGEQESKMENLGPS